MNVRRAMMKVMNSNRPHKSTKGVIKTMVNTKVTPLARKKFNIKKPKKDSLELKKVNLKLHKQILKYQAEIISLRNEIRAIKENSKAKDKWEKEREGGDLDIKTVSDSSGHKKLLIKL
jgi:hypothetical protein